MKRVLTAHIIPEYDKKMMDDIRIKNKCIQLRDYAHKANRDDYFNELKAKIFPKKPNFKQKAKVQESSKDLMFNVVNELKVDGRDFKSNYRTDFKGEQNKIKDAALYTFNANDKF